MSAAPIDPLGPAEGGLLEFATLSAPNEPQGVFDIWAQLF